MSERHSVKVVVLSKDIFGSISDENKYARGSAPSAGGTGAASPSESLFDEQRPRTPAPLPDALYSRACRSQYRVPSPAGVS